MGMTDGESLFHSSLASNKMRRKSPKTKILNRVLSLQLKVWSTVTPIILILKSQGLTENKGDIDKGKAI